MDWTSPIINKSTPSVIKIIGIKVYLNKTSFARTNQDSIKVHKVFRHSPWDLPPGIGGHQKLGSGSGRNCLGERKPLERKIKFGNLELIWREGKLDCLLH